MKQQATVALHERMSAGQGPATVVLLHGLFGASANLGALARHLQGQGDQVYRVLSCDLRNHGRSAHVADMDYHAMAADVLQVLDRHAIAHCALIGHSMGGKVAMQLALDYPERVNALIVADIAPVTYAVNRHDSVFAALHSVPLTELKDRHQGDVLMSAHVAEADVRQFLLSSLYQRQGIFQWRFNLPALYANRDQLSLAPTGDTPYPGPVLFIKGANSDYLSADSAEAIKPLFPQARLHVVQNAGHWLHAEKPVPFNAAVSRFLSRYYPVSN